MRLRSDALVSAARTGDENAWRELYAMHSARIVALIRALPRGDWASSAEDLVAEAWLTAATKMEDFHGSDDAFGGWLFTIARNHASNSHRTAVRRRTDPEDVVQVASGFADDAVQRVEAHDEIRGLLARLSPREAEVVACIDVGGLDVACAGSKPPEYFSTPTDESLQYESTMARHATQQIGFSAPCSTTGTSNEVCATTFSSCPEDRPVRSSFGV